MDQNEIYNKAVKIESSDMFEYGMRTNVGNAFVYGILEAVDSVTFSEIGGEYLYVKKVEEEYTKHTRTVNVYDDEGKFIGTREEEYWTWDEVDSWDKHSEKISFLDVEFDYGKIKFPSVEYITTLKESSTIRYKYYGTNAKYTGTIFTKLKNQTISNNTSFYQNMNIKETVDYLESDTYIIVFWVLWSVLICGCVTGFYYIDNKWLE